MALYIAFEGGEGSGKSTQARRLAKRLSAVLTHEPGNTALGKELRRLLLGVGEAPVSPRAETLMMAADRAQHMEEVVRPALERGDHVVSDRTVFSSLAYQGGGRELGVEGVRSINEWALDGLWPDLVILLECPTDAARSRRSRQLDRLEAEDESFHRRVHDTFSELAAADPARWLVLDGTGSIAEVEERVWAAVADKIDETAP